MINSNSLQKQLKVTIWPLTLISAKRYHILLWRHVLLDCTHFALSIVMRFTCMSHTWHRCIKNEKNRVSGTPLLINVYCLETKELFVPLLHEACPALSCRLVKLASPLFGTLQKHVHISSVSQFLPKKWGENNIVLYPPHLQKWHTSFTSNVPNL